MRTPLHRCLDGSTSCVELTETLGEWFVRVVTDGRETVQSFELESFAIAYAKGQRMGLGLKAVIRPLTA